MAEKTNEALFYGPKFVDWLTEQGLRPSRERCRGNFRVEPGINSLLGPSLARTYNRWQNGECATLQSVDNVCMRLGLDMNFIPDEVYKCKPGE